MHYLRYCNEAALCARHSCFCCVTCIRCLLHFRAYPHCSRRDTCILCVHMNLHCARLVCTEAVSGCTTSFTACRAPCVRRYTALLCFHYLRCARRDTALLLAALLPRITCTCSRRDTAAVSHVQCGSPACSQLSYSNAIGGGLLMHYLLYLHCSRCGIAAESCYYSVCA